jgi:CBS domain-containing protein
MPIRACDVMSRSVVTVAPGATLREAIELLHHRRISGVPVAGPDGRPLGMISRTDLFGALDKNLPSAASLAREPEPRVDGAAVGRLLATRVEEVMSRRVVAVREDAPLAEVAQAMVGERVHRVLVLRDGRIAGIVSAFDLANALSSVFTSLEEDASD